jgi:hypothetical protein
MKKSILSLRKRGADGFLRALRRIDALNSGKSRMPVRSISLYPSFDNIEKMGNVVNRLAWALPFREDLRVIITADDHLSGVVLSELPVPAGQANFLKTSRLDHFSVMPRREETGILRADKILIHEWSRFFDRSVLSKVGRVEVADEMFFETREANAYQSLYFDTLSDTERGYFDGLSRDNYAKLLKRFWGAGKAYCFVSGPSFDRYPEFAYEGDSVKIICNTIVKNAEFLDFIKGPDILTFADPAYHFGPSAYADAFRECVKARFCQHDFFIVVPRDKMPLLLRHYPDFEGKIVGMPRGREFNFPDERDFWIKGSDNILSMYMLPVASALARSVYIIGADGRDPKDKLFWTHSRTAQFNGLMRALIETHPSFFSDLHYENYYKKHCDFLEKFFRFGAVRGREYLSLTESKIPAIRSRLLKEKKNDS